MPDSGRGPFDRGLRKLVAVACACVAAAFFLAPITLAAEPAPDPDSACAMEKTFKSIRGTAQAQLTFINNTSSTMQSIWLDYDGKRVHYENIPASSRYTQPTWLTHPWIVAGLDGTCYRLVVMTSQQQVVTVNPGGGSPIATLPGIATLPPLGTPPPVATLPPVATVAPVGTLAPVATLAPVGTAGGGPGFPILSIVGGVVGIIAIIGVLAATGKLPTMFTGSGAGAPISAEIAPPSLTGSLPAGALESLGLTPGTAGKIGALVDSNMASLAGNLFSGFENALQSLIPPGGAGGAGAFGSGPDIPPGTGLSKLGLDSDAIRALFDQHAASTSTNLLSGIHDAVQNAIKNPTAAPPATSGSGGGIAIGLPGSMTGSLPAGMLESLGLTPGTSGIIGELIDSQLDSLSSNLSSGLEQALQGMIPSLPSGGAPGTFSSAPPSLKPDMPPGTGLSSLGLDSETIRTLFDHHVGSTSTNLLSGIHDAVQNAVKPPPPAP